MEKNFWLDRWRTDDIGFHAPEANRCLTSYWELLELSPEAEVFVPLCGKSLDVGWLLHQGHQVRAAELSDIAIEGLFAELRMTPEIEEIGRLRRYSANRITVFVGDLFDVTRTMLGPIQAVYDRAALVALPLDVRKRYTSHLSEITARASQLLVSFDYDQAMMEGPPFSVPEAEIDAHYSQYFSVNLLESLEIPGGLKGVEPAREEVFLVAPR